MSQIKQIYNILLKEFGYQGWWPLISHKGSNPTKTGSVKGYHPKDYSFPKTNGQRFEICIGAILTQNTSWTQVEKALLNLEKLKAINPKAMSSIDIDKLKKAIKPAGYFNQKAKKLKKFTEFYIRLNGKTPTRDELLGVWGVGPETADSILLYAYKVPSFVIDAYTKRIMERLGFKEKTYDELKEIFEKELEKDHKLFNEYHALLVELEKRDCDKDYKCDLCSVKKLCKSSSFVS